MIKILILSLLFNIANSIAIRQFSDDSCTQLSQIKYLSNTKCYSFASTGSYLIKECNCTLVEYNFYDGALCLGNYIGTYYVQQNTCLSTRQTISCYEDSSGNIVEGNFILTFLLLFLL